MRAGPVAESATHTAAAKVRRIVRSIPPVRSSIAREQRGHLVHGYVTLHGCLVEVFQGVLPSGASSGEEIDSELTQHWHTVDHPNLSVFALQKLPKPLHRETEQYSAR